MVIRELPKKEIKAYVIKYDYEDCTGFGAIIVFGTSHDDAVNEFKKTMFANKSNEAWYEHTYRDADFRMVSKNIYGWYQYFNNHANVCIKCREINMQHGNTIPIQEYFEDARIDHIM